MDPVEDLVQQRLDHALVHHDLLLVGLGRAVELDDVPQVVLRVVEQQPHLKTPMDDMRSLFCIHIVSSKLALNALDLTFLSECERKTR